MRSRYIGLIFLVSIALLGLVAVQIIGAQAPAGAPAGGQGAPAGAPEPEPAVVDAVVPAVAEAEAVLPQRPIPLQSCVERMGSRI